MICFMVQILCEILMQVLVQALRMRHHVIVPADFGVQMEATQRNHQERYAGECKNGFGRCSHAPTIPQNGHCSSTRCPCCFFHPSVMVRGNRSGFRPNMGIAAGRCQGDLLLPLLQACQSIFISFIDAERAGNTFPVVRRCHIVH